MIFLTFGHLINVLFCNTLTFYEKSLKNTVFHFSNHKGYKMFFFVEKVPYHNFFSTIFKNYFYFFVDIY